MDKPNTFVTGATGLVGYHVVKHLLQEGYPVVACIRASSNSDKLNQLAHNSLRIVTAELNNAEKLAEQMAGCQVIVHCAGAVDPHARKEDIVATNVDGTKSVVRAASRCGVRQVIHVSSLSVITGQEDQFNVNETAPLRYCGEAYADSKVDAEKAVQFETSGTGLTYTILRPGFIYGPGEKAWMPRLINNIKNGKAMLIDGGTKQTNVIYVENLAKAVQLSILNERAFGQAFNLTDGATPSKKELFDSISDGLGLPRVTKKIPGFIARGVCELVSTVAPALSPASRQNLSRFSRAAFRLAGVNQGFDISKAERELGYTNRISFAEGMTRTLRDFGSQSGTQSRDKEPAVHS